MKRITIFIFIIVLFFGLVAGTRAITPNEEPLQLLFFYSPTCPHCHAEAAFLDDLAQKYPELKINRYLAYDPVQQDTLQSLLEEHNALEYFGAVPITFVGKEIFIGFDNAQGIGSAIENSVIRQLEAHIIPSTGQEQNSDKATELTVPTTGSALGANLGNYSLFALAVSLGALDGFNVCSLSALILILSLVLALRSRRKVIVYGGIFIVTTAVVYGLLIIFWHRLFLMLGQYVLVLVLFLGALGLGGAVYFFKEFLRFRREGVACQSDGSSFVSRLSKFMEHALGSKGTTLVIAGSVLLFAGAITIVEFPCSAAVPVMFAGLLAKANLSTVSYSGYLGLYLVFYFLDELVVFGIAAWKLSLWVSKGKFVIYATFIQAALLLALGVYYLTSFVR